MIVCSSILERIFSRNFLCLFYSLTSYTCTTLIFNSTSSKGVLGGLPDAKDLFFPTRSHPEDEIVPSKLFVPGSHPCPCACREGTYLSMAVVNGPRSCKHDRILEETGTCWVSTCHSLLLLCIHASVLFIYFGSIMHCKCSLSNDD